MLRGGCAAREGAAGLCWVPRLSRLRSIPGLEAPAVLTVLRPRVGHPRTAARHSEAREALARVLSARLVVGDGTKCGPRGFDSEGAGALEGVGRISEIGLEKMSGDRLGHESAGKPTLSAWENPPEGRSGNCRCKTALTPKGMR